MIETMTDLPEYVLGFNATGEVTAQDYRAVLVPAIEQALASHRKIRLLYVLGEEFQGYTGAAAWEDAKVGLAHLTRFDRVAVVTDVDWLINAVKAFGFVMPCEVRVFGNDALGQAREWILEPLPAGNLSFEFREDLRVLILRPHGELHAADFQRVAAKIDPYIEQHGELNGIMIVAEAFPGWDDFAAFAAHLRFVGDHRKQVRRMAIVTSDRLLSAMPHMANHFLVREARHFGAGEESTALAWTSNQRLDGDSTHCAP